MPVKRLAEMGALAIKGKTNGIAMGLPITAERQNMNARTQIHVENRYLYRDVSINAFVPGPIGVTKFIIEGRILPKRYYYSAFGALYVREVVND